MDNNKFHDKTYFVPGSFKKQLKYCYFKDNKRIDQLQDFIFPYIKKRVSVQAGISKSCAYLINGEIKKYPFLDPDMLQLRINPSYRNPFDREEACIKFFPKENAIEFLVFIYNTENNRNKTYHPKECGFNIDEYDSSKWKNYGKCCGEFIVENSVQTILNKFYSLDDHIYQKVKEKSAIMIQRMWRGWHTRSNISWILNTKLG